MPTVRVSYGGHEERFPPTKLSACCGFRKETIAGMCRNGRDARDLAIRYGIREGRQSIHAAVIGGMREGPSVWSN